MPKEGRRNIEKIIDENEEVTTVENNNTK